MKALSLAIIYSLLITMSLIASPTFASESVELKNDWIFKSGDQAIWRSRNFVDDDWEAVDVPKLLFQGHNEPVKGWYRINFDYNKADKRNLALLIETIRHADQTWLNDQKIGGLGSTYEAWDFFHTNPQSLPRLYKISDKLLEDKNNVLAIKINVGFGQAWGAMFPGGAGITKGKVLIGNYDALLQDVHNTELKIVTLDTVFAVLGILDLLIILFLIKTALGPIPEFKWLLACSFFLLLGASAHDINFLYSVNFIDTNFSMFTAMLVLPYTTAMYFWSQNNDIPKKIILVMTIVWLINVFILLYPAASWSLKNISWYIWNIQAVACFVYAIYASFKGLLMKRIGAYAQFLGIIIYTFSIRSQWLPEDFFGHRNIQFGSIFYRYALLFAYFQQLIHIRIDFKKLSIRVVNITDQVRHSIARELHDGIGQHLASSKLQTQLISSNSSDKKQFNTLTKELDSAIKGLRRIINGLHPVVVDRIGLSKALHSECSHIENIYNVKIKLEIENIEINKTTQAHIFHMTQECISNAIKHGNASQILILLSHKKNSIELVIADNGKGFDTQNHQQYNIDSGYGFVSLQERVVLLNGDIEFKSKLKRGSKVLIKFPYADGTNL